MAQTILITGGTGYLGSRLTRRLLDTGHRVVLLRRAASDLSRLGDASQRCIHFVIENGDNPSQFEQIFAQHSIDSVLHCATNYGRSSENPALLLEANLILPLQLLHHGSVQGVRTFINTDTLLTAGVSPYATSKKQFLEWLKNYSEKICSVNVALEHFYGPDDDPSKFVTQVIRKFLKEEKSIPLTLGEQRRDFIYIDDVVDAFTAVIEKTPVLGTGYHPFEIGSGKTISIRDFLKLTHRLSGNRGTELAFGALPYRPNEVMESKVNLAAVRALGYEPRIALEEGLSRTIDFEKKRMAQ